MAVELHWGRYRLIFKTPAKTSRNILTTRPIIVLQLRDTETDAVGWGEVAPLTGLSPDDPEQIERWLGKNTVIDPENIPEAIPANCPALRFGLEMALMEMKAGKPHHPFPGKFTAGQEGIPINGLIWMNAIPAMEAQFHAKIEAGFTCLKMKIGALDIQEELSLLARIRDEYRDRNLEIRVDANGAFTLETVFPVLEKLAALNIHSIEQPLPPGNWNQMREVCRHSPIPIALDEECIGITEPALEAQLLDTIQPDYIILKPTFLGGFGAAGRWIKLAEARNSRWWVTSALESNIGLNALAQWTATLEVNRPQGLGTGTLFTNNFSSPLAIRGEKLRMNPKTGWNESQLQAALRG